MWCRGAFLVPTSEKAVGQGKYQPGGYLEKGERGRGPTVYSNLSKRGFEVPYEVGVERANNVGDLRVRFWDRGQDAEGEGRVALFWEVLEFYEEGVGAVDRVRGEELEGRVEGRDQLLLDALGKDGERLAQSLRSRLDEGAFLV